jgi:hypothetical protein
MRYSPFDLYKSQENYQLNKNVEINIYISQEEKSQIFTHHFAVAGIIQQPGKFLL